MTTYTRAEILDNRTKWANFLLKKGRKKATGLLDKGGGNRCCLGHGCYILGVKAKKEEGYISYDGDYEMAPEKLIEMLGLWGEDGRTFGLETMILDNKYSAIYDLASLNDETSASSQTIGKYLLTVLEGGKDTPFKPLKEYPEYL